MHEDQQRVAAFIDDNGLHAPPAYRLLDLTAEIGEIAADAAKSSDYGADPEALSVRRDELGDALFSLLALAEELDMEADVALEEALDKYESRIDADGTPGSEG
jgi:NTP pyrophosphatase (non-canonical NTP hydrolase)